MILSGALDSESGGSGVNRESCSKSFSRVQVRVRPSSRLGHMVFLQLFPIWKGLPRAVRIIVPQPSRKT